MRSRLSRHSLTWPTPWTKSTRPSSIRLTTFTVLQLNLLTDGLKTRHSNSQEAFCMQKANLVVKGEDLAMILFWQRWCKACFRLLLKLSLSVGLCEDGNVGILNEIWNLSCVAQRCVNFCQRWSISEFVLKMNRRKRTFLLNLNKRFLKINLNFWCPQNKL